MTPMLAPLVGDAPTVTFIGLCKNAGKTTAMCRLMEELPGETLALTSVGRDGERTDVVTGTEKPEIWVRAGTLFATARGMFPLCDATLRVEVVTDVMTPLGAVGILRALSDGYIQLAGPSAVSQLGPLSRTFRALGAQRVLIDGAAGRRSLAGVEPGAAAILCVGASVDGGIPAIAAETAHICALFDAPEGDGPALRSALREEEGRYALFTPDGERLALELEAGGQPVWRTLPREDCVLWVGGGVTGSLLRTLARRGAPIAVATPDATHFLCDRASAETFHRCGGRFLVAWSLRIAAVAANPWSAYGRHLDGPALLAALRAAVEVSVVDVREESKGVCARTHGRRGTER